MIKIVWAVLILILPFFFHIQAKTLKIGFLDTGFCIDKKVIDTHKNIRIFKAMDHTTGRPESCQIQKNSQKKYHGRKVLNLWLRKIENLKQNRLIEVYPQIIFDLNGRQDITFWNKAFDYSREMKLDLLIIAAGLPLSNKTPPLKNNIPIFLSSGQVGGKIRSTTTLWPQVLSPHESIYLIGSYRPHFDQTSGAVFEDPHLLYREKVHYYMSAGKSSDVLGGTSRAVTLFGAKAIKLCFEEFKDNLRNCLKRHQKKIPIDESKKFLLSI